MDLNYIKALGFLISNYETELNYIFEFHENKLYFLKEKKINPDYLSPQKRGSFQRFLNDFRVARNVDSKKGVEELLKLTFKWLENNPKEQNDVHSFAKYLKEKKITRDKLMISLSSKILFLNNPWEILPVDSLVRKTVGIKKNNYMDYITEVESFKKENEEKILEHLISTKKHLEIIENKFENKIVNLPLIRYNRFIDKLLWANGK